MALFVSGKIRAQAFADLDNSISSVENYAGKSSDYQTLVDKASCNINFAERIGIITSIEAREYRDRLNTARNNIIDKQNTDRINEQIKIDKQRASIEHRNEELSRRAIIREKSKSVKIYQDSLYRERNKY